MKTIHFSCIVHKSVDVVWSLLSTQKGIERFFGLNSDIDFKPYGKFEIYFDMAMEEGLRGSEGMHLLCLEPPRRIGFTWNAPPSMMPLRNQLTAVYIEVNAVEEHKTKVSLFHTGFGESEDWVQLYAYFVRSWRQLVLPRFIYAAEQNATAFEKDVNLTSYVERIV